MLKLSKTQIWGALAIALLIALWGWSSLVSNPTSSQRGSSYSRSPDGYGAWYNWMETQGTEIKRSLQPLNQLESPKPITVIQVHSQPYCCGDADWVNQGNTLVILGATGFSTAAEFTTLHNTEAGEVKIETRRRKQPTQAEIILSDAHGAIAWQEKIGQGKIISVTTPYIAANAYQDYPGNYQFLANLVQQEPQPIWMDEYLHGYRDSESIAVAQDKGFGQYFSHTSIFPLFLQLICLFVLIVWGQNQTFGAKKSLSQASVDNSQTYIEALACILHKAQKSEYILSKLGQHHTLKLQQALGLGNQPLTDNQIIEAWVKQTNSSGKEVQEWLQIKSNPRHLSETELVDWLRQGQQITAKLPKLNKSTNYASR